MYRLQYSTHTEAVACNQYVLRARYMHSESLLLAFIALSDLRAEVFSTGGDCDALCN
jgi:hypothetical protein